MISRLCAAAALVLAAGCAPSAPPPSATGLSFAALPEGAEPDATALRMIARGQNADGLRTAGKSLDGCWLETRAAAETRAKKGSSSNARYRSRHDLSLFDLSAPRVEPISASAVKLIYRRKNPYQRHEEQAEKVFALYADTAQRFLAAHDAPGDVSSPVADQRTLMIGSLQSQQDWWVRYRPYVQIRRGYPHVPMAADVDLPAPKPGAELFDRLAYDLAAAPVTMETQLVYESFGNAADKLITASYQIPGELRLTARSMDDARLLAAALREHAADECPGALR